jgi:hypothetical protein
MISQWSNIWKVKSFANDLDMELGNVRMKVMLYITVGTVRGRNHSRSNIGLNAPAC